MQRAEPGEDLLTGAGQALLAPRPDPVRGPPVLRVPSSCIVPRYIVLRCEERNDMAARPGGAATHRRCIVLSDHERKTLREFERQFQVEDPEFTRSFGTRAQRLRRRHLDGAWFQIVAALQLRLLQTVVKVAAEKNLHPGAALPRGTAPLPRTRQSRGDPGHRHPGDHRAHAAVRPTRRHFDGPRTSGRSRCLGERRGRDRPGTSRRSEGGNGSAGGGTTMIPPEYKPPAWSGSTTPTLRATRWRGGRAGTINTYTHIATDWCESCPYRATPHPIRAPASMRR